MGYGQELRQDLTLPGSRATWQPAILQGSGALHPLQDQAKICDDRLDIPLI